MRTPILTLLTAFSLLVGCALLQSSTAVPTPPEQSVWALNTDLGNLEHETDQLTIRVANLEILRTTTEEHSRIFEQFEERLTKLEALQTLRSRKRIARVLFFSLPPNEAGLPTCPGCIALKNKLEPQLKSWGWSIGDDATVHLQHIDDPTISSKYNIKIFPTLLIVEGAEDTVIASKVGNAAIALSPTQFVRWVNPHFVQARQNAGK